MSLGLAARLARRELRGGLKGFRIFLACLALGVAAIAGVGSVRSAIEAGLTQQGATLLGGDAQAEFTYRFATDAEKAFLHSVATKVSETVDFRSMAVVGSGDTAQRGLTQVRAVDDAYPLIGKVTLDPAMPLATALAGKDGLPGAVVEKALTDRLGLAPGDTFKLGTQTFVLSAILTHYPDNAAGGFGLGPRMIVLTRDLANSGLIQPGTLYSTDYRLLVPPGTDLAKLKVRAEKLYRDAGMRWSDARHGAPGTARFVDRMGSFLILVGLCGLAVGGVGVSAAVRTYLAGKTGVIATLKTLGATRATIFQTYFLQIGALTLLGIALGVVIGGALPLVFAPAIAAALPIPADFSLYPAPLAEAALYGLLSALIFTLWPLARTDEIRAATLFRDASASGRALPAPRYLVATALLLAALLGAAAALSGAVMLTLWTAAGVAGALVVLALAAIVIRTLARRGGRAARGRPALRLALGAIGARGGEAVPVVLSLGLGLAVLASIGQIDGNLRRAFSADLPKVAPSYFFVDIQPDQIDGFRQKLADNPAVSKVDAAPMLRGIITKINGIDAQTFAHGHWVVQGDRGVTYSTDLPPNTTLTEGKWWPADYNGPPLMSFSAAEAKEIGLKLGDTVTVNILGRDITATISSFREVHFESAGIGFVMSMDPAALRGAPHSWIATVYCTPEAEGPILRELASAYPNITAIRIRDAIAQAMVLVGGISSAVRYGALATLLTGFLVLIGAAAAGEQARTYEAAVLKTLGATRPRILASFALRSGLLGLAAGLVALGAGVLGGWAVLHFVMETDFTVIWGNALTVILGGIAASMLAGLGFALRAMAVRPAQALRGRE
ncbi:MAG: FtsX-like permease family protein [Limimaricola sp.]|uniref:ABC transporter permease n=1 Tax=Limimaricola sp. TaxID=2211665 RepID=UPI001DD64C67|nr:FtsX-like permease family protein [Limimaricola sp.]MBI1415797.1 FtsX-like permease family protein [Limimaricola sp.]